MMKKPNGFSVIETLIVISVVILIAAIGWLAYTNMSAPRISDETSEQTVDSSPVTVESESDLDSASSELDKMDLEDSNTAELDNALGSF